MTYDPEKFTPTERRILDILADGQGHTKKELLNAICDEFVDLNSLRVHVCNIRGKLPADETLICEFRTPTLKYRHIKMVPPTAK